MTPEERQKIYGSLEGMVDRKYLYENTDVVTVKGIAIEGDIVTIVTDIWDDSFDITGFDEWFPKFVITRKKSAAMANLEASILEKSEKLVEKDEKIAGLEKQLMVMRNVVNSRQDEKEPKPEEKEKSPSIYPFLYDLLLKTAAAVSSGEMPIERSVEVRECCRLMSEISEVQNRVILSTRKPVERKELKRR